MLDISSNSKSSTCTNVTSTNTTLRSAKNAVSVYRGTSYYYPQKAAISLIAECLSELGFNVTIENSTVYYNHLVLNDYSEDICLQLWNSAASTASISFLYPRHVAPMASVSGTFNSTTSCRATIRMVGEGAGRIRTLLLLGSTSVPALTTAYCIYFTEARHLLTGEMKKAIVIQSSSTYYFYLFDADWTFLPGFNDESTTAITMDSYWHNLTQNSNYCCIHDPYTSHKLFVEQSNFPEIPVVSNDGLWEFPDIIQQPYGYIGDSTGALKYSMSAGSIYQIGNKKYLCNYAGYTYYLFRVE